VQQVESPRLQPGSADTPPTVRDAALATLREFGLTTIFSNPGSTEIDFLGSLPDDFRFVLGLHEASVVGMATGYALGSGAPAFAVVHTTAGLGNAVSALATARVNRAPLVVVVGQQDRRHIAYEPFLTGRLAGLAGDYPVWVGEPAAAQAVPGALARAFHEAQTGLGPALVIVPMDDWATPALAHTERAAPARVLRAAHADPAAVAELASLVAGARAPVLVSAAGVADEAAWAAVVALAERLQCPVFHEPFSGGAGFPQDHPLFAGHLPPGREQLRARLRGHDVVLVVGGPALRQYLFEPGELVDSGTRMVVVTADPGEAHRSAAELVVVAPVADVCTRLTEALEQRAPASAIADWRPAPAAPPTPGEALTAAHVLDGLARRLPADAVLFEESPSNRPQLLQRIAIRAPMGLLSPAMGGLGFALPAATGVRMALPQRPVVAVVGDGSAMYCIQALWSAAHYGVGVVFVILSNGGYRVMDQLAHGEGLEAPWPSFGALDITAIAHGFGCEALRVQTFEALEASLDDAVASLATRETPLLLEVVVE
jgi:benzoylformate decarboxylase